MTTIPNWGDLPIETQRIIFQYVEPSQYLYIALTCKLFHALYMDKWEIWTKGWNFTLYRNGVASIKCAALAMQLYPETFHKSEYRLCLIYRGQFKITVLMWLSGCLQTIGFGMLAQKNALNMVM